MTTSPASPAPSAAGNPPAQWGHQHPNCKGEAAIAFFTNDLARIVQMHLGEREVTAEILADAQRAVDALLRIYIALQAAPYAFEGQSIELRLAMQERADGPPFPYVALITSPRLENLIIEMQERERTGLA